MLTDVHFYSGHREHNEKKLVIIMGEKIPLYAAPTSYESITEWMEE
jgi:hypothetical protein